VFIAIFQSKTSIELQGNWSDSAAISGNREAQIPNEAQVLGNLTLLMMIASWHSLAPVNNIRIKHESEYDSVNFIVRRILDKRDEAQFAIE
jgi:hypothetical protein